MNVNDMNARKQAKYVKKIRIFETPFKDFGVRVGGLAVLTFCGIYVLLETLGAGTHARKRQQYYEDLLTVRTANESKSTVLLRGFYEHNKNRVNNLLTFLRLKDPVE